MDPRPVMRAAKAAHAPIRLYNKTETHWNLLGAFYGYLAADREALRTMMPLANRELASHRSLPHHRRTPSGRRHGDPRACSRHGDLPMRMFGSRGSRRFPAKARFKSTAAHFVQRNPRGKGRIVLYRQFLCNALLVPFLAQHFAEMHRYAGEEFDGAVVARHRPDIAILETLESYPPRLLLPPINLHVLQRIGTQCR